MIFSLQTTPLLLVLLGASSTGAYVLCPSGPNYGGPGRYCLDGTLFHCDAPGQIPTFITECNPGYCKQMPAGVPDQCAGLPAPAVPVPVPVPVPVQVQPLSHNNACTMLNYEEVECEERTVPRTKVVTAYDKVQVCTTRKRKETQTFEVQFERDFCTKTPVLSDVVTKIPTSVQTCDEEGNNCRISTTMKEYKTTDHVYKWECAPRQTTETLQTDLPVSEDVCTEEERARDHRVMYTAVERICKVVHKSKKVCTTSEKQQAIEQSAASYSVDASEMHSWVVSPDGAAPADKLMGVESENA